VNALVLLSELRSRDIYVWEESGRLKCDAPAGALTPELVETLRERSDELIGFMRSTRSAANRLTAMVPLQPRGSAPPIFGVPGHNGDVFCFISLARHLGEDQPFYGLQPPGVDGRERPFECIEDLAAHFEEQIRAFNPNGPFVVVGQCAGCVTAFELGRRLHESGAAVESVALFGAPFAARFGRLPRLLDDAEAWTKEQIRRTAAHASALRSRKPAQWREYFAEKLGLVRSQRAGGDAAKPDAVLTLRAAVERATLEAARRYRPRRFGGRLRLFLPSHAAPRTRDQPLRWRAFAAESEVWYGPTGCRADTMLREPYAKKVAEAFRVTPEPPPPRARRSRSHSTHSRT